MGPWGLTCAVILLLRSADCLTQASHPHINSSSSSNGLSGPSPSPPGVFDFYHYAVFWPPSTVPEDAQGRARATIRTAVAAPGFWLHGLWPEKYVSPTNPKP